MPQAFSSMFVVQACFHFQSTPLHEGRLANALEMIVMMYLVSIHVPTRGATRQWPIVQHHRRVSIHAQHEGRRAFCGLCGGHHLVSIHAPTRGATYADWFRMRYRWMFQSTPLHEGRRNKPARAYTRRPVSIHAPTRGATYADWFRMRYRWMFQSTPLHEGRRRIR